MRLSLTSDTHLPKRATELPPSLLTETGAADVVLHAGDRVDADLRRQPHCACVTLQASGARLTDVRLHRLPPRT
jgi:predicted phosphodiesterase